MGWRAQEIGEKKRRRNNLVSPALQSRRTGGKELLALSFQLTRGELAPFGRGCATNPVVLRLARLLVPAWMARPSLWRLRSPALSPRIAAYIGLLIDGPITNTTSAFFLRSSWKDVGPPLSGRHVRPFSLADGGGSTETCWKVRPSRCAALTTAPSGHPCDSTCDHPHRPQDALRACR